MSNIKFLEETHQYINEDNNHEYLSVSRLIALYKNKFDSDNISKAVARKRGVSQDDILNEWNEIKEFACHRGTAFHLALEENIKFGEVDPNYKKVIESFQLCISNNISDIESVHSEILCSNDDYEVAGMSDLCWNHNDNTFTIGDFKTNKRFRYISEYNKWFFHPLNHLMECEFNIYTIQLSIYAFMYELMTGRKCKGLLILWLDQTTGKWEPIRCNYLKHEVVMLLSHYKRSK